MNSSARKLYNPVSLSLFITLATLPCLFYRFHYHDIGWNLSKSWMIVEHPDSAFWELSWLSSWIGGFWMELGMFNLVWLRIGFILVAILTFLLLYRILRFRYSSRESTLALLPTYILYTAGFEQLIPNYYTVPSRFSRFISFSEGP